MKEWINITEDIEEYKNAAQLNQLIEYKITGLKKRDMDIYSSLVYGFPHYFNRVGDKDQTTDIYSNKKGSYKLIDYNSATGGSFKDITINLDNENVKNDLISKEDIEDYLFRGVR